MKQPKSIAAVTAKPLRASVTTTKRGRTFTVCPNCSVIGAPIALGAERFTCKACGANFELSGDTKRAR